MAVSEHSKSVVDQKTMLQEDGNDLETLSTRDFGEAHAVTELDDARFSLWSVLGVQYTLSASPIAICGYMGFTLGVGGSPYFFWCLIVAGFMQGINTITLAELASAFPHVAGRSMVKSQNLSYSC